MSLKSLISLIKKPQGHRDFKALCRHLVSIIVCFPGVAHQSTSETSQSCTEAHIEATDSQASNIVASSIFNSDYAQLYKNLLFASKKYLNRSCSV